MILLAMPHVQPHIVNNTHTNLAKFSLTGDPYKSKPGFVTSLKFSHLNNLYV